MLMFIKKLGRRPKGALWTSSADGHAVQVLFLLQTSLLGVKQEPTVWRGFGFNPEPFYRLRTSFPCGRVLTEPQG